ncbi:hypothetical protein DFJ73DRAFT_959435 [Zopfochytrium polystomum]|nr:hypothetical protein DFJ73DRAFT_959435 [Zopfochytrium polystomum]
MSSSDETAPLLATRTRAAAAAPPSTNGDAVDADADAEAQGAPRAAANDNDNDNDNGTPPAPQRTSRTLIATVLVLLAFSLKGLLVVGLAVLVWLSHLWGRGGPPPQLADVASPAHVIQRLADLERLAAAAGRGSRATARGHPAAADYVVAALRNHTDFAVWKQPFSVLAQTDFAPPALAAVDVAEAASAGGGGAGLLRNYSADADVATAVGSGSGVVKAARTVHVLGCDPALDLAAFGKDRNAVALVGWDGAPARSSLSSSSSSSAGDLLHYGGGDGGRRGRRRRRARLSFPLLGGTPTCRSACDRAAAAVRAGARGVLLYQRPTPLTGYPHALPPFPYLFCASDLDAATLQTVPVVALSQEAGYDLLLRAVAPEGLRVDLAVNTTYGPVETCNVLAETKTGDPDRVLLMGSHLDSVEAGPGVNDDGSGAMATLELALAISRSGLANQTVQKVRFAWWGAEESGLEGSQFYAANLSAADLGRVKLTLDTDMIASPNYVRGVWDGRGLPDDDDDDDGGHNAALRGPATVIQEVIEGWFRKAGLPTVPFAFNGRSDFVSFMERGIPAGGVITGEDETKTHEQAELFGGVAGVVLDPCYHQSCDTVASLRGPGARVLGENLAALAHAMQRFALESDVEALLAGRVPI